MLLPINTFHGCQFPLAILLLNIIIINIKKQKIMIKIYLKILKNRFKLLISFISFIIVSIFLLIPLLFGSNLYPFVKGFYNFKKQVLKYELMQLNMKINQHRLNTVFNILK